MGSELRPLVRHLGLARQGDEVGGLRVHTGSVGGTWLAAAAVGVGPAAAGTATARLLEDLHVDHVLMAGVAGGVAPELRVADVVIPAEVLEAGSGRRFRPSLPPGVAGRGTLLTAATLSHGEAALAELRRRGIAAVDMESAAVAAVCVERRIPWSVARALSDLLADGLVDETVLALTGPDGRTDPGAVARLLLRRPGEVARLARLGRNTARALGTLGQAVRTMLAARAPG